MFFNRMGLAVFWGITAVILLPVLIYTACNPVTMSMGGQPASQPASPTQPSQAANLPAMPAIEVFSTLPPQIREQASRLQFTPVSATKIVTGELDVNESASFVLWAQAGQTLSMLTDGKTKVTLLDARGLLLATATDAQAVWATLPTAGDYFVTAEGLVPENGRYRYTLKFSFSNNLTVLPTPQSTIFPATPSQSTPIEFNNENPTSTVEGILSGSEPKQYHLSAAAGEILAVFLNPNSPEITVIITGQDGQKLGHTTTGEPFAKQLTTSQTYSLTLTSETGVADVGYSLTVSMIRRTPYPTMPEQIIISSCTSSASFSGTVDKNTNQTYPYDCTMGQHMMIDVVPANSGITISVRGEDGVKLGWTPAGIQFSAVLPSTQLYFIDLVAPGNTNEALDYVMTVTIQ